MDEINAHLNIQIQLQAYRFSFKQNTISDNRPLSNEFNRWKI